MATMETALPKLLRTLERDVRGYPIPFIVMRDEHNKPIFTMNDPRLVRECVRKGLCSICGKKLGQDRWFVSGSRAFLHPDGLFIDPPIHLECAEFALRVCPFLAATGWSKAIGMKLINAAKLKPGVKPLEVEHVGPVHPEWFGLGQPNRYDVNARKDGQYRFSVTDWRHIEFWKNGQPVAAPTWTQVEELLSGL
jgi:hypothetical protein